MVCGQKEQIIAFTYLGIKRIEKIRQVFVQCQKRRFVLFSTSGISMGDSVGGRDAYGQHVSDIVLAKLLILQGRFGHLESGGDTKHVGLDVKARLGVVLFVELLYPFRQLLHIIGRGHKLANGSIPPVCRVCRVASG